MLILDPAPFDPARIDAETAAFNADISARLAGMAPTHTIPPAVTRKARDEGKGLWPPAGPLPGSDWVEHAAGSARMSRPEGAPRGLYLHIHGGGWTLGNPAHYDAINQHLARETGCLVASLRYRLAPENPWPAPVADCVAGAEWAMDTHPGLPVLIGGESAGAHLAACTLLALRARGRLGRLAGAVLNYGCYDLRMTASMANWGPRNLILSTPTVDWFVSNLMPDPAGRADPAASPLLAPLHDMPPALFQIGTADPLIDDSLQMAARWAGAGRRADLAVWPGGIHAFDMFDLKIARAFRARQIAFMLACL